MNKRRFYNRLTIVKLSDRSPFVQSSTVDFTFSRRDCRRLELICFNELYDSFFFLLLTRYRSAKTGLRFVCNRFKLMFVSVKLIGDWNRTEKTNPEPEL